MELLTVKEVAAMLHVNPITVRRHIASGRLRCVRVGRLVRIPRDAVERFTELDEETARILREARPTSDDDPLWRIIGMFDGDGPTDVASNKYKYLVEDYFKHLNRDQEK